MLRGRLIDHPVERPAEVHGRRPSLAQHPLGRRRILSLRDCERIAVRGGDPDCGRPAYDHRPDRVGHLSGRAALDLDLDERQAPLIEQHDAVALEAEDPLRFEHA